MSSGGDLLHAAMHGVGYGAKRCVHVYGKMSKKTVFLDYPLSDLTSNILICVRNGARVRF